MTPLPSSSSCSKMTEATPLQSALGGSVPISFVPTDGAGYVKLSEGHVAERQHVRHSSFWTAYLAKWAGKPTILVPPPSLRYHLLSLMQATLAITTLVALDRMVSGNDHLCFASASFGATSVLIYSAVESPLGQPRNVIYGQAVSSFVGVTIYKLLGKDQPALAAGLAVGLAIVCMERLGCLHPPGGASAIYAVIGTDRVHQLGYWFILFPCVTSSILMLAISLVINNLQDQRSYPQAWVFPELDVMTAVVEWISCCGARRQSPHVCCCVGCGGGNSKVGTPVAMPLDRV